MVSWYKKNWVPLVAGFVAAAAAWWYGAQVLSGTIALPQGFWVGPLFVRAYGLCMAAAVLSGLWLAGRRAAAFGIPQERLDSLTLWLVAGGLVGARLYHVATDFSYYRGHPLEVLALWQGGLSIYGAVLGGALALWFSLRRAGLSDHLLKHLDWFSLPLLLGQLIGRLGNAFNYELYGYPTDLPWRMFVPEGFRLPGLENAAYFHPLFLYEVLLSALWFFMLSTAERRGRFARAGSLFFSYLLLYNAGRFALEFLRADPSLLGPYRLNAGVSLSLVVLSVTWLWSRRAKAR